MNWSLENPVETATATLRVVSEYKCHIGSFGQKILGYGTKVPRVIFLMQHGAIFAVDMTGRELNDRQQQMGAFNTLHLVVLGDQHGNPDAFADDTFDLGTFMDDNATIRSSL